MYSDAISSPLDGVSRPSKASDARNETSAFSALGVMWLARVCGVGRVCAAATASKNAAGHTALIMAQFLSGLLPRYQPRYFRLMMPRQSLDPQEQGTSSIFPAKR